MEISIICKHCENVYDTNHGLAMLSIVHTVENNYTCHLCYYKNGDKIHIMANMRKVIAVWQRKSNIFTLKRDHSNLRFVLNMSHKIFQSFPELNKNKNNIMISKLACQLLN